MTRWEVCKGCGTSYNNGVVDLDTYHFAEAATKERVRREYPLNRLMLSEHPSLHLYPNVTQILEASGTIIDRSVL